MGTVDARCATSADCDAAIVTNQVNVIVSVLPPLAANVVRQSTWSVKQSGEHFADAANWYCDCKLGVFAFMC